MQDPVESQFDCLNSMANEEDPLFGRITNEKPKKDYDHPRTLTFNESISKILFMWVPFTFSEGLMVLDQAINLSVVSHQSDTTVISAVVLGNMMLCMVAESLVSGLNSALETYAAQAYGAGDLYRAGVILHRSRLVYAASFVLTCFTLNFTDKILIAIG